ncbi:MAG: TolC family protein [Planctomycetota bacterium]
MKNRLRTIGRAACALALTPLVAGLMPRTGTVQEDVRVARRAEVVVVRHDPSVMRLSGPLMGSLCGSIAVEHPASETSLPSTDAPVYGLALVSDATAVEQPPGVFVATIEPRPLSGDASALNDPALMVALRMELEERLEERLVRQPIRQREELLTSLMRRRHEAVAEGRDVSQQLASLDARRASELRIAELRQRLSTRTLEVDAAAEAWRSAEASLAALQEQTNINAAHVDVARVNMARTEQLYEQGNAPQMDLLRARENLMAAEARLSAVQAQIEAAAATLDARAVGRERFEQELAQMAVELQQEMDRLEAGGAATPLEAQLLGSGRERLARRVARLDDAILEVELEIEELRALDVLSVW